MNQVFAEPTKLVLVYVTVVCLCEGHSEFQIRRLWKQRRKWLGDWWPLWEQLLCDLQSLTELLENGNDNESEDAGWRAICRRGQQGWLNGSWGCPRDGNRRSGDQQQTRRKLQWLWRASEVPRERVILDRVLAVPRTNGSTLSKENSRAFFPGLGVNADSVCGKRPQKPFAAPLLTAWKLPYWHCSYQHQPNTPPYLV